MATRILFINDYVGAVGGAERYVAEVSQELANLGWEVHIAFGKRVGNEPSPLAMHPLPMECVSFPWLRRPDQSALERLLGELCPDRVFLQNVLNPDAVELCAREAPTFRFVHDHRLFCPEGKILWRGMRPCEKPFAADCLLYTAWHGCMGRNPLWLLANMRVKPREIAASQRVRGLVVASEYMKRCLVQQGFDPAAVHVNPLFSRFRHWSGPREEVPRLLYAGQLSRRKGVPGLIRALPLLPDPLRLDLVGETSTPEDQAQIERALRSVAPERVGRLGWRAGYELLDLYRTSVALIVPSLWPEPFGLVAAEALSQSCPVVAFDVGGLGEMVRESQGGIVVPAGDWPALSEAILRLWKDPQARRAMGQRGARFAASHLTVKKHVERLLPLLDGPD